MTVKDAKARHRVSTNERAPVLVGMFLAMLSASVLAAVTAFAGVDPASGSTLRSLSVENTDFGYRVDLPSGWRRSDQLSRAIANNPYHRGHDVFTLRTPSDEDAAIKGSDWLGPAWQGAVIVEVYRNSSNLTPLQWATRPEWDWREGQLLEVTVFAGRPAVVIRNGARFAVAYYVANGPDMFVVAFTKHADWQPRTLNAADLQAIISSFRFTR